MEHHHDDGQNTRLLEQVQPNLGLDDVPDKIDLSASIRFLRKDAKKRSKEVEDLITPHLPGGHPIQARKEFLDAPFQSIVNQRFYSEIQKRKNYHE